MHLIDNKSLCVSSTMNQDSAIYFGNNLFEHTLLFCFPLDSKVLLFEKRCYCGNSYLDTYHFNL